MPSSRPSAIPVIVHLIKQLKPTSILDVGVGFGKWGHLFREYTDIASAERDPSRYHRQNWQVRIDGIEGFPEYITDMHRYLYNEIIIGDVRQVASAIDQYDVIFLGDIIEHVTKQEGIELLKTLVAKANLAVIVSTPKYDTGQQDLCGNELERHHSLWTVADFATFPNKRITTVGRTILIAVIVRDGVSMPRLKPETAGLPTSTTRKLLSRVKRFLTGRGRP